MWSSHGIGGPFVFVLLSLVNEETALGLVIGQNLGKQGDRTEFWKEEGRERERETAMELPESDMLNLSQ